MRKHIMLSGGLGNQLFQYTLFLSFQKKGIPCLLDTSEYIEKSDHNGYELQRVIGVVDKPYMFPVHNRYLYKAYKLLTAKKRYNENTIFQYDENVFTTQKKYINGCWLSSKYQEDLDDEIRDHISFIGISDRNIALSNEMLQCNSISVHIRRGDYLKIPRYNVCTESYYEQAIMEISKRIEKPVFYIFSDDTRWCEHFFEQFEFEHTIVSHNRGTASYQDMFLMSCCKNNIIANSTFSWWGARLNANPSKLIIGPSKWISTKEIRIDIPGCVLIDV